MPCERKLYLCPQREKDIKQVNIFKKHLDPEQRSTINLEKGDLPYMGGQEQIQEAL